MKTYEEIEKIFDVSTPWTHFSIKDWLPEELFNDLKKIIIDSYNDKSKAEYDPAYGRWLVSNMPFYEIPDFYDRILEHAKNALKPHDDNWDSYVSLGRFGWKYESIDGVIPSLIGHKDTNGGSVQFDIVIDSSFNWGLQIEDHMYTESTPNEAIVFNGQKLWHSRPDWKDYSSSEKDFLIVEFFVFAPKDHWFLTHGPDYLEVFRSIQKVQKMDSDETAEGAVELKEKIAKLYNAISITKELSSENEALICEQKKLSDELREGSITKIGGQG